MQQVQEMSHEKIVLECLPFNISQRALAILLRQDMHPVKVNLIKRELQHSLGRFGSETCRVRLQDTIEDSRTAFDDSGLSTHTYLHKDQLAVLCPFVADQSKESPMVRHKQSCPAHNYPALLPLGNT